MSVRLSALYKPNLQTDFMYDDKMIVLILGGVELRRGGNLPDYFNRSGIFTEWIFTE